MKGQLISASRQCIAATAFGVSKADSLEAWSPARKTSGLI
ncbi:Unknown protein sequence [Pseudomonas amygdali pv. lachrymans]|uniref:Uncharacterized protein n=1 Tax=Pseudomonas amygdali pv. lachrymans TaxID=53707 RepID=A0ABR5KSW7_PSEAV|nr:Unknown protein sequence [Pseudomonas amygdali pv. lachrymans]